MYRECDPGEFNIDMHLVILQNDEPFFCEISRHIKKIPTDDPRCPTAAIAYLPAADEIVMYYNVKFFSGLSNKEIRNVLVHEFYHSIFGHVTARMHEPHVLWNIGTDCGINSILVSNNARVTNTSNDDRILPAGCVVPGQWVVHSDGRSLTKEEKMRAKLADFIAKLPPLKASEWYFNALADFCRENDIDPNDTKSLWQSLTGMMMGGRGGQVTLDNHDGWGDVPEELREYVESKIKEYIEKATRHADSRSDGWGSVPMDIREEIRRSVSNLINWKSVLRQFVGTLARGNRMTSIKRINRCYPYIHPGTKRGYEVKLLVAMDQSGSVYNEMLEEFFGVLASLTKKVSIDVLYFDCGADEKEIFTWRKGQNVPTLRKRCGGTDFNAPTNVANDSKNRKRWDGMLILTDGLAPQPVPSRIKRGWVLGKGCKLEFETHEVQVCMDHGDVIHGAWR